MRYALVLFALLGLAPLASAGEPWIGVVLGETGGFGGVRVKEVVEGSPGAKAGLKAGDEVLSIDDHKVETSVQLINQVRKAGVGHEARLRLVDGKGHTRAITLLLEAKPDMETLQRNSLLGRPAPDFAPAVQSGQKLGRLSSLKGQVVLIDFFATWCGPCVAGMPHVEALHEKLGPKGLRVIGVSTESASIVARAAEQFGLKYTLASDENEGVSASYRVFALPTMIVIDRHGVVREVAISDPDTVDAAVESALKAK